VQCRSRSSCSYGLTRTQFTRRNFLLIRLSHVCKAALRDACAVMRPTGVFPVVASVGADTPRPPFTVTEVVNSVHCSVFLITGE
jgi:hypothetical protein